jgi:hypothetical protein
LGGILQKNSLRLGHVLDATGDGDNADRRVEEADEISAIVVSGKESEEMNMNRL